MYTIKIYYETGFGLVIKEGKFNTYKEQQDVFNSLPSNTKPGRRVKISKVVFGYPSGKTFVKYIPLS